jgi:maleylpyruvate isomerase
MTTPAGQLAHLRSTTAAFLNWLDAARWTDADLQQPSLLPEWTRGHVLTHIARNADSISRTVAGALRGEVVARYPGGPEQRAADIETGAARSATEQLADVRESADKLDRLFAAVADADAWDAPADKRAVGEYVGFRWREVEIHWVDMGGSYRAADWPASFVSYLVPALIPTLDERTDEAMHVVVDADGSVASDLVGQEWTIGAGKAIDVVGPDWAIGAWLAGRTEQVTNVLSATPILRPWM